MTMRNSIVLFFAVIIILFSLIFNILYVKSFNTFDISFIDNIDKIYFDNTDDENLKKIKELMNISNMKIFNKLITKSNNPIAQFYGFLGIMKVNPKLTIQFVNSGIISSPKKVQIVKDGTISETTLGYSILLLLVNQPKWIKISINDDYFNLISNKLLELYKSNDPIKTVNYNNILSSIVKNKFSDKVEKDIQLTLRNKNFTDMTEQEKYEYLNLFDKFSEDEKNNVISNVIKEQNTNMFLYLLGKLSTFKPFPQLNPVILRLLANIDTLDDKNKVLLLKSYSEINERSSIQYISKIIKSYSGNKEILITCLDIYQKYGSDENWEFITYFMGDNFSTDIHLKVIDVIIAISSQDNIIKSLRWSVVNSSSEVAEKVIRYLIEKNSNPFQSIVLSRLKRYENDKMKKLTLEYIEKFKVSANDILENLSTDPNNEIQSKAKELLVSQ